MRRGRSPLARRKAAALTLAALIAAAIVVSLFVFGGSSSHTEHGPSSAPFSVKLPAHWKAVSSSQLSSANGPAIAAYERTDGTAVVLVRRGSTLPVISQQFVKTLDARFRKNLPGYAPLAARIITTKAGAVFFFSYVRRTGKKRGTVDTVVLVPAGDHSFVLDTVSNPTSTAAAKDLGSIIDSFRPR